MPRNQPVDVQLRLLVPQSALDDNVQKAGIYFEGERLVSFTEPGLQTFKFTLPPQNAETARVNLIVSQWDPPAGDTRKLGIQYLSVQVTVSGVSPSKYFDVNQQEWIGE